MSGIKEFSVSNNGDRWGLDMDGGEAVVVHMGNEPSGGHETRTPLADFLRDRTGTPEHAALLQVLGQTQAEVEHQLGGNLDASSHETAAEGSCVTVEREPARREKDTHPDAEPITTASNTEASSPGSEAAEPSPGI